MEQDPPPVRRSRPFPRERVIHVAAPDGASGGGMGRVKDYMMRCPPDARGRYRIEPLVTRDARGAAFSLVLMGQGMARIARDAVRGRLALVHVHMGDRGSAFRKAMLLLTARWLGAPAMLHLHAVELDRDYARMGRWRRAVTRWPFHRASAVIVLGQRFRDWVVDEMGVDPARVEVVHNGVDLGPRPPRLARPAGVARSILFLGEMGRRKGLADLMEALHRLPAAAAPWHLSIAGGGDAAPFRMLAEARAIADRVSILGWVDATGVARLLAGADMLVLPSYEEGLPLVILEALSLGVPVVCTPVGSIGEVLTDGDTALLVPPGDADALAGAIARLLADEGLARRLADRGHALFDRQFSLPAFLRRILAIWRSRAGVDYRWPDGIEHGLAPEQGGE